MTQPVEIASDAEKLGKDLRLDRIVTWFLMLIVGVGISIASLTYSDLRDQMKSFGESVNNLSTSVALIQQREERVTELRAENAMMKADMMIIQREVRELQLWRASETNQPR